MYFKDWERYDEATCPGYSAFSLLFKARATSTRIGDVGVSCGPAPETGRYTQTQASVINSKGSVTTLASKFFKPLGYQGKRIQGKLSRHKPSLKS